ncbi:dihydrolipoyl dehydrogenase family protein [Dehalogenimonas etheniformans]|uniref:NAD(P)/FAD-dependent oxidoreductase n=1 Tax=Dehalogenimonas etheniformans TaxID=1536648 RepID=A0A2P5P844_9CHLR|nr:NAD(P)/FAD-dependent oxidoreductase [Dehalogenimonas etheniformans]PPD58472.1 NAD(P)/FAD-dependent oxidoreductase [Dehalogenimonas etheniformans]QNT76763.1 NAD(P)/FAD-dependent oxidoreductase [Dehalogenimonas etheniformans]
MKKDFDLIIIGSGLGGLSAAIMVLGLGKKVAIIESGLFGGKCTWNNCLPLKALIRAGHAIKEARNLGNFGFSSGVFDSNSHGVFAHVKAAIASRAAGNLLSDLEAVGITVMFGQPHFTDENYIELNGKSYSSRFFLIATGSTPVKPVVEGIESVPVLTCETIYDLDHMPKSIIILGGGPDGVEFAQAFRNIGLEVSLVDIASSILNREDNELTSSLVAIMKASGIRLYTGCRTIKVVGKGKPIELSVTGSDFHEVIQAEVLLTTAGRAPAVGGLQLENAGVKYSKKGIQTDAHQKTSTPNIYACGDVTTPLQLAMVAEQQGLIAANNMFIPLKKCFRSENIVSVVFSDPPLAHTGLTEIEAIKRYGSNLRIYRYDYRSVRRAGIDGGEEGSAKVITTTGGKLVGAHILGVGADEIIQQFHLMRHSGKTIAGLHDVGFAFPTYSEGIVKRIGDLAYLDSVSSNSFVKLGLKLLPGYKNNLERARRALL